jgi:hypothetical protein
MTKNFAAPLLAILFLASASQAQDKVALTQLLKSEEAATTLISELSAYDAKSPWATEVTWRLTQRLAVKGIKGPQITRAIIAGGDIAAALDADDRLFASIVWLTVGLLKEKDPEITLYDLEAIGVPAFEMLAELLDRRADEIRKLARQGRLNSPAVFEALTTSYLLRYKGMAEKLAIKRAG